MSKISISALDGIVGALNEIIFSNKAYLSEIDGAIGDGDHGINMAKGFGLAADAVAGVDGEPSVKLKKLSNTLMTKIGGSMGPLYGMFFKAIAESIEGKEELTLEDFRDMITAAHGMIAKISPAKPGDKTLVDCLVPAVDSLNASVESGEDFSEALDRMKTAAEKGRDSTKDLVAKLGRSSRLGERSRGVLDAGSCSCCMILSTFADEAKKAL